MEEIKRSDRLAPRPGRVSNPDLRVRNLMPSSAIAEPAPPLVRNRADLVYSGLSGTRHYVSNFRDLPAASAPRGFPAHSSTCCRLRHHAHSQSRKELREECGSCVNSSQRLVHSGY